jgi:putative transposase
MNKRLALVVRAYPTKEQDVLFRKTLGCCRFVYNYLLDFRENEYQRYLLWKDKYPDKPNKDFKWKSIPTEKQLKITYPWLTEPLAQSLQQSRKDLQVAYSRFFKGIANKPRFHKKGQKDSFRIPQSVRLEDNSVFLQKYGYIKIKGSLDQIRGTIKSATIKLIADKWYVSILYEVKAEDYYQPVDHKVEAIGIDLGIVNPLTVTGGSNFHVFGRKTRKNLQQLEHRRKRYQRQLARKVKGSNNRKKAKLKVAIAFQKEANVRKNFQHQVSHRLTKEAEVLIFEDLKLSNMTRSAKGTLENPGTNVRQKSGLNREMLRIGLAGLINKCVYKAHRRGGNVIFVDPKFTSQTCSSCGTIDKLSRKSQARFQCIHCGFKLNADKNASLNILARGIALV